MKVFNFKNKKITLVDSPSDKDLWRRLKDKKIKEKFKEIEQ